MDTGDILRLHFADGACDSASFQVVGIDAGVFVFSADVFFLCSRRDDFDAPRVTRVAETVGGFGTEEVELRVMLPDGRWSQPELALSAPLSRFTCICPGWLSLVAGRI